MIVILALYHFSIDIFSQSILAKPVLFQGEGCSEPFCSISSRFCRQRSLCAVCSRLLNETFSIFHYCSVLCLYLGQGLFNPGSFDKLKNLSSSSSKIMLILMLHLTSVSKWPLSISKLNQSSEATNPMGQYCDVFKCMQASQHLKPLMVET